MKSKLFAVLLTTFLFATTTFAETLSWNANTESDLAGYDVFQGTAPGQYGPPFNVGKATDYTFPALTPDLDTTYYWAVKAYDNAGNRSSLSAEVSKFVQGKPVVPAPVTPILSLLTVTDSAISLIIDAKNAFEIRYGVAPIQWGAATPATCPLSPCTITGLAANTEYEFKVVGYTGELNTPSTKFSVISGPLVAKTSTVTDLPPDPPTGIKVVKVTPDSVEMTCSLADCPKGLTTVSTGSVKKGFFGRTVKRVE